MSSLPKKSLLDTMTQKLVESQAWRSLFRHGYPDTPLNQSLVMMGNVFLHLHPVKVSRQAMKITYTWCMGGISFFLFLLLTITGVFLMFYYVPDTNMAYQNINQLSTVVSFGHLTRNMHRWAAHLMVVSVTLLQRSVAVEIDPGSARPVRSSVPVYVQPQGQRTANA